MKTSPGVMQHRENIIALYYQAKQRKYNEELAQRHRDKPPRKKIVCNVRVPLLTNTQGKA